MVYLLQFLCGEMLRISLFSIEFLQKGMNYSGLTLVNGTKFKLSIP